MFSQFLPFLDAAFFTILSLIFALILGMFLFWRTARRELVDNQVIFDTVALFFAGSFVGGRIVDFIVRPDFYTWSLKKLIFFNAFWGFDAYGALIGGIVAIWLYLRKKRENFWDVMDYASEGLALSAFVFFSFRILMELTTGQSYTSSVFYASGFLLTFWLIKRIAKQKRHRGFFVSLYLTLLSILNLLVLVGTRQFDIDKTWWTVAFSVTVLIITCGNWYLLSKRKLFSDVKSVFGFVLLSIFKAIRALTNIREADSAAKFLILSPYLLAKSLYNFVKYLGREIYLSFVDLIRAFNVKK